MDRKIVFVTTHPIQYIVPLYQEMGKDGLIDFEVLYFTDETIKGSIDKHFGREIKWDIPLLDNYRYRFLKNYSWKPSLNSGFFGMINFGIIRYLYRLPSKSLIVVGGWSNFSYILTIIFSKLFGHKCSFRTEAPIDKELNREGVKNKLRYLILKILFKFFIDCCFYIGTKNKSFYKKFGFKDKQLFYTPYCVDNNRFNNEYLSLKSNISEIKRKLNIPVDSFVVLFTGKFYEVKRPFDLLNSFSETKIKNKFLIMVGDGILMPKMKEYVEELNLLNVQFPGFKNQSEISEYYAIADVFVLCSESETWGLSVNEAMNFSLPLIIYDTVACSNDLLINGKNGFLVKKGDLRGIVSGLEFFGNNIEKKIDAGNVSKLIIEKYSYSNVIKGFKDAIIAQS